MAKFDPGPPSPSLVIKYLSKFEATMFLIISLKSHFAPLPPTHYKHNCFFGISEFFFARSLVFCNFHENQLTYPWSPNDQDVKLKRDNHYSFINYTSALAADYLLFNSAYHRNAFIGAIPDFLNQFPDATEVGEVDQIKEKSEVLHLGMDLKKFDKYKF